MPGVQAKDIILLRSTRVAALLGALVALVPAGSVLSQEVGQAPPTAAQRPCEEDPRLRAFDFWLGTWDVFNPDEQHVGVNRITKLAGGCALLESWEGDRGGVGNSINYFDPQRAQWVQTWVGGTGYVIDVAGAFTEGAMRLEGRYVLPDGTVQRFRGAWTPLADGRVRQLLESAPDSSGDFETWFDGYYVRRDE